MAHAASRRYACLWATTALVLAGCGSGSPRSVWGTDIQGRPTQQIGLRAENRQFADAVLYAWSGGERLRLGTVTSKGEATFRIPWEGFRPLRIHIDLVGGGEFTTAPVNVEEGEWVSLVIEADVARSTLFR